MYSRSRNKLLDTSLAIVSRLHFHSRVSLEWFVRQSPLMAHVWKELEAAQEQQWLFVLFGDACPAVCCHGAPLPGVVSGTWSLYGIRKMKMSRALSWGLQDGGDELSLCVGVGWVSLLQGLGNGGGWLCSHAAEERSPERWKERNKLSYNDQFVLN